MRRTGPLIVGGGPAGCAAALTLATHGIAATLLERDRETRDAICGGFMSWRTLANLERLGAMVSGHAVGRVVLFAGKRRAEAPLPGAAIGLSRRTLDSVMLALAETRGHRIERGVSVRDFAEIDAETTFLATGKHDLRGAARPRDDGDSTLGLRVRLPAHPRLTALIGDAIELHLFDRGYAGLVLQEDGSANLCLAVRKSRLAEADSRPEALLTQIGNGTPLGERLAFADGGPADAIAAVPYGWRATETAPGVYRLGDQAAVIPSLAGEGIGIAIASGISAAGHFAATGPGKADAWQSEFARRTRRPVTVARALWHAGERPALAASMLPLIGAIPGLAALAARLTRIGD